MEEKNIKDTAKDIAYEINNNFIEDGTIPKFINYSAVSKFKSVRRAIRRGHVDLISGVIYPDRPFNNRKPTRGREHNQLKKSIYDRLKRL